MKYFIIIVSEVKKKQSKPNGPELSCGGEAPQRR
jgi:hypothetical protein